MYKSNILSVVAKWGVALVLGAVLSACGPKQTFVLISTNDIHAEISKFPLLASYVEGVRAADTAEVILVDAGDRWTGNPYVDMAPESGQPMIELLNALEYDVVTLGNHEFDRGLEVLNKRNSEAEFEIVCANINTGTTALAQPKPYVIKEIGGVKFGFAGFVTNFNNGHPDGEDYIFEGTDFPDVFATAASLRPLADSCDVLIGLSHLGYDMDPQLVEALPEMDILVGGHTHTVLPEGEMMGTTLVTQTGKSLRNIGVTTIKMRGKKILSIDNHLVPTSELTPSEKWLPIIEAYYDVPTMKEVVGSVAVAADKNGVANLLSDLLRKEMKSDFAFYHQGGVRVDGFEAGDIVRAKVFEVDPFESRGVMVEMSLAELKTLIMNKFNDTTNPKESHSRDLLPSGLSYTVLTDEKGDAVDVIFDYKIYPAKEKYTVVLADYIHSTYNFKRPQPIGVSELVTTILEEYFQQGVAFVPDNNPRVDIRER